MEVIGLTGGIGTGKSTASKYLAENGFAVIDADRIAREIVEPGQPLLGDLEKTFGSNIIKKDGSLDRKALAAIVFADNRQRKRLDQMMHKKIIAVIEERIAALKERGDCKGIILDAPLLFETGLEKKCSCTWLITAEKECRIKRVCMRDGVNREEVEARIRSQLEDQEKRKLATVVIDNSTTQEALYRRLDKLLCENVCLTE